MSFIPFFLSILFLCVRFYAHLSCVIWIPEAHVVDTATMGPVCVCVCACVRACVYVYMYVVDTATMGPVKYFSFVRI